jgi:hypothetical protein
LFIDGVYGLVTAMNPVESKPGQAGEKSNSAEEGDLQ